jgi:DNA-directed RNA polymerase specialized sigma24 family protein
LTTWGTGSGYRRSQARRLDVAYAGSYPVLIDLARTAIDDPLAAHNAVIAALATVWDGGRDVPDRSTRDAWLRDLTGRVARRGSALGRRPTTRPESRPGMRRHPEAGTGFGLGAASDVRSDVRSGAGARRVTGAAAAAAAGPPPGAEEGVYAVRVALAQLHRDDADLVRMAMTEDCDPEEVARTLGCTQRAVEVRLQRARVRLRHDLRRAGENVVASGRPPSNYHSS